MKTFAVKPQIIYGDQATAALKRLAQPPVLVIADPFLVSSGKISMVTDHLPPSAWTVFSDIVPDPPVQLVAQGVKELETCRPASVVAVGGGSAIDAAKAMIYYSSLSPYFIAIPTTSGTGSEVTSFSVITDPEKGVKHPLVSDDLLPDAAVLDTEFVISVPQKIVADTGVDVLTHAIEAFVSTQASDFSDAFAEKAAKMVFAHLLPSYRNDVCARGAMHRASLLAGLAFNSASLGLNHAIAHNIGGKLHIPHGRTNAMLLPHIIKFNSGVEGFQSANLHNCAERYALLAKAIGVSGSNTKMLVRGLLSRIRQLLEALNVPSTLSQCGVDLAEAKQHFDAIAEGALQDRCITTNPRTVQKADILKILHDLC